MEEGQLGILAGIIITLACFVTVFGIAYLHRRERMAMIERGMDPRNYNAYPTPHKNLKWGLLLIGSGLGLFLAFLLHHTVFNDIDHGTPAIYFSLIAIFGGAGLVLSYRIEKKELLDKE